MLNKKTYGELFNYKKKRTLNLGSFKYKLRSVHQEKIDDDIE